MSSLAIHPIHEAKLIAHAVRNIPGGADLVKKWQAQKKDFTEIVFVLLKHKHHSGGKRSKNHDFRFDGKTRMFSKMVRF